MSQLLVSSLVSSQELSVPADVRAFLAIVLRSVEHSSRTYSIDWNIPDSTYESTQEDQLSMFRNLQDISIQYTRTVGTIRLNVRVTVGRLILMVLYVKVTRGLGLFRDVQQKGSLKIRVRGGALLTVPLGWVQGNWFSLRCAIKFKTNSSFNWTKQSG